MIHQLKEEWETRDHMLIPYQAYIRKLIGYFDDIFFITFLERRIKWSMRLPL